VPIKAKVTDLSADRAGAIKKIISPILPDDNRKSSSGIRVQLVSSIGTMIFGVVGPSQHSSNVEKFRFPTAANNIFGYYQEVWVALSKTPQIYTLEKAYFHLYEQISVDKENEYILLHADPNEPKGSPHYNYKCGPHLHFEFAPPPLPRAHIALNLGNLKSVINSLKDLDIAIHKGVSLLRHQVLDSL
jgi:hypothetical protein